jgi:methylase of polypeptide subunit release factors
VHVPRHVPRHVTRLARRQADGHHAHEALDLRRRHAPDGEVAAVDARVVAGERVAGRAPRVEHTAAARRRVAAAPGQHQQERKRRETVHPFASSRRRQDARIADAWAPHPDRAAAAALGDALRSLGYTDDAFAELLGEDGPAAGPTDVPVFDRRLDDSPLATAIRLLLLQLPQDEAAVRRALGDGAAALVTLGLAVEDRSRLVPRGRIVHAEGLLMSSDGFSEGDDDPPGWVANYTPTGSWLASLTPRHDVERALDLGTGNGAQALLAARHSGHVIATDVNERALGFTAINAALNGLDNVETRLGSLFDPVGDDTFDLITCNAPYVVSPETKWQYRDAGFHADQLSATLVAETPAHLNEDGFAAMLVSWVARGADDADERVFRWIDGNGCDAWIVSFGGADPLDHTAGWNDHIATDPAAYGEVLDEWIAYFEQNGIGWISEGGVILRKRDGSRNLIRLDSADEDELEYASDQVERVFDALELLAEDEESLLDEAPALAESVVVERTYVELDEGTHPELELDPEIVEAIEELDGTRTVREVLDATSRRREALDTIRELLLYGFLEL